MAESVVRLNGGRGTRAYVLRGAKKSVLVDAGLPGMEDQILAGLRSESLSVGDVSLILITHGHTDHFGSAAALRERLSVPVAVHALDAEALEKGIHQPGSLRPTGWLGTVYGRIGFLRTLAAPDQAPALKPDLVFVEPFRLERYGVSGRIYHTPGHTPGSISVRLDSGEAIVGDLVMGAMLSRMRKPTSSPLYAWDLNQLRASQRLIFDLAPTRFYAGHGGPFLPEDVAKIL